MPKLLDFLCEGQLSTSGLLCFNLLRSVELQYFL
jgi:hypothetical protein